MKNVLLNSSLVSVIGLSGCATYQPVVDLRGVDQATYQHDLAECQSYAGQVDPTARGLGGGAAGAAFGALLGAAVGAALGADVGHIAALGAAQGGVTGAGAGVASGANDQMNIVRRCMAGRGYNVLN